MMADGWRLIVAQGPVQDNNFQWNAWLRRQVVPPGPDDVRIDVGAGGGGDWNRYWVRAELPWSRADRVVVIEGNHYDSRRRKNNTVLGTCTNVDRIVQLVGCLDTTMDERPSLMMPGTPTLAFLSGRSDLIATVTVLDGRWIRSNDWSGDAPLRDPAGLQRWLTETVGE